MLAMGSVAFSGGISQANSAPFPGAHQPTIENATFPDGAKTRSKVFGRHSWFIGGFHMLKLARLLILLLPVALLVTACDDKGPAQKAGEKIDKAVGNYHCGDTIPI
jgi:hypothetical protein